MIDQIETLVSHLQANPHSRRAVLQMWDPAIDLYKLGTGKDLCCNLCICFSIGLGTCKHCEGTGQVTAGKVPCHRCEGKPHDRPTLLDMTVFNRSNDLIWGMLGSNYVHFSMLQEYMAARLELEVGRYHQVTNNLHVYTQRFKPDKWLQEYKDSDIHYPDPLPMFENKKQLEKFEKELSKFVHWHEKQNTEGSRWTCKFLRDTVEPLLLAFHSYKRKETEPEKFMEQLGSVKSLDWKRAATAWISKRI